MKAQYLYVLMAAFFLISCAQEKQEEASTSEEVEEEVKDLELPEIQGPSVKIQGRYVNPNSDVGMVKDDTMLVIYPGKGAEFFFNIPMTGRYRLTFFGFSDSGEVWMEDYINNTDGRTYDITGRIKMNAEDWEFSKDGSPLDSGRHDFSIHAEKDTVFIRMLHMDLIKEHLNTPESLTQNMTGTEWKLKWSDEFDYEGLPDQSKWDYNVGDWGWGNNEPQYYTYGKLKNARVRDGVLTIEAHKNDEGMEWSSARLTTQGKVSFTYGKIEFRAKVPEGRGTWAAGWMLGDSYRDELSWPYCGEIDILECVGYEINDTTGNGLNHATCHTPAYYFKQGNQISSVIEMENMNGEFHTYAVEWYPDSIRGLVDGKAYYLYDKTADELEWPFNNPQNIIVNLAVGGGWGGAKGIDPSYDNHQFILDYVRVYELQ